MRIAFNRRALFCAAIACCAPLIARAQQVTYNRPQVSNTPPPAVRLTTERIAQRYCVGSAGQPVLQMRLRVRYWNEGQRKLILYKGHNLFYQTQIRRASADERGAKPYEVIVLNARYFDEQPENLDTPSPSAKHFAMLAPGGVFETELTVSVGVARAGERRGANAVEAGTHTLQLVVSNWYKSKSLADTLRERWQRRGLLVTDPLASVPVTFDVETGTAAAACR